MRVRLSAMTLSARNYARFAIKRTRMEATHNDTGPPQNCHVEGQPPAPSGRLERSAEALFGARLGQATRSTRLSCSPSTRVRLRSDLLKHPVIGGVCERNRPEDVV